jgi:hypothetical protein
MDYNRKRRSRSRSPIPEKNGKEEVSPERKKSKQEQEEVFNLEELPMEMIDEISSYLPFQKQKEMKRLSRTMSSIKTPEIRLIDAILYNDIESVIKLQTYLRNIEEEIPKLLLATNENTRNVLIKLILPNISNYSKETINNIIKNMISDNSVESPTIIDLIRRLNISKNYIAFSVLDNIIKNILSDVSDEDREMLQAYLITYLEVDNRTEKQELLRNMRSYLRDSDIKKKRYNSSRLQEKNITEIIDRLNKIIRGSDFTLANEMSDFLSELYNDITQNKIMDPETPNTRLFDIFKTPSSLY